METTWSERLYHFYKNLKPAKRLPNGVQWLFPQAAPGVMDVVKAFLDKYYGDAQPRRLMLGINPGRFGAGVTGVNFTAPRQLTEQCDIVQPWGNGSELSAEFIYEMINAGGGPELFYSRHFIGSVCPLGFVKNGKNINYYDDPQLQDAVEPFIIANIEEMIRFGSERDVCLCIGGEKNFKYLSRLNERFQWFDSIIPLPHPRFIMQYRRKQKDVFIDQYLQAIKKD